MPVYLAAKTSIAKDCCASGNLNSSCPEFFLQLCGCAGKKAFTLAEVLITLGIIGVVAAMTLPGLVQNYQKKVTVTRLEAAYSQIRQAVRMSEVKNGEIREWHLTQMSEEDAGSTGVNKTKKFVQEYIEPYLKAVHKDELISSGTPYNYSYYTLDGALVNSNGHTHYSIALNNGVYLHFNANYGTSDRITLRIDINGRQKPNIIGIDTFYMYIYPNVQLVGEGEERDTLLERCKTPGAETNGYFCGALIQADGWEIKDEYPWK